jgi:hypothetical protein
MYLLDSDHLLPFWRGLPFLIVPLVAFIVFVVFGHPASRASVAGVFCRCLRWIRGMLEYFLLEGGKVPTISRYNEDEDTEVCRKGSKCSSSTADTSDGTPEGRV